MTEPLIVDTDQLDSASKILGQAAGAIPAPLPKLSVPGTDPLSLAVATGAVQVEAPMAALSAIEADATTTAQNIGVAGQKYAETDRMQAEKAAKQTFRTDDDDEGWEKKRKYGKEYSKSKGKGVTTPGQDDPPIWTKGDVQDKWGTPTDTHDWSRRPPVVGDYDVGDAGKGGYDLRGPGAQGQAYATRASDGVSGKASAEAWAAKGDVNWGTQGGLVTANANAAAGLKAEAEGALTDHGIYGGAEVFGGVKAEISGTLNLGPLQWTGSAAGAAGAGAGAHGAVGIQDGVVSLGADANLAWGLGGGLGSHLSIDLRAIGDGLKHAEEWLENVLQAATP
jgi:hypothetical protein